MPLVIDFENAFLESTFPITVSSQKVGYRKENLRNQDPYSPFAFDACADERITLDMLNARSCFHRISFCNTNMTKDAQLYLESTDDGDFSSPINSFPFSAPPFIYNLGTNIQAFKTFTFIPDNNVSCERYISLRVVDPTNPDGYVYFGTIAVGGFYTTDEMYIDLSSLEINYNTNTQKTYRSMSKQVYQSQTRLRKNVKFTLSNVGTDIQQIFRKIDKAGLERNTFISIAPDPSTPQYGSMAFYGNFNSIGIQEK
jgi:hypothetical protein